MGLETAVISNDVSTVHNADQTSTAVPTQIVSHPYHNHRNDCPNNGYNQSMINKALSLLLPMLLWLAACEDIPLTPTLEPTPITAIMNIVEATETAFTPPSPTPIPTATTKPTSTPIPTPTYTPTPESIWPTASLLFVRDNKLQQWLPETGKIETLVENVMRNAIFYSGEIAVFIREIVPDEEYALIAFYIPTQSEIEVIKASTIPTAGQYHNAVSVSPNGRWLVYVAGESRDSATLTVQEILIEDQRLTLSEPVFTLTPAHGWYWPYEQIMWATENELSWSDKSGIWVADLSASPIEPAVVIAPSTNTYAYVGSPNPANWDNESSQNFTRFIPDLWSPDGRYLLVNEYFNEYGEFRVIERDTNRLAEVPESAIGAVSDDAVWLDATTLIHYQASGNVQIWQVDSNSDPLLIFQKAIPAVPMGYVGGIWVLDNHLQASNYSALFDIDLETGELVELASDIDWPLYQSPDGQYVLWGKYTYIDEESQTHVFLSDLRNAPIELDDFLGLDSCCWHWNEK